MFRGTFTALVPPFREGAIDYTASFVIPSNVEESLTFIGRDVSQPPHKATARQATALDMTK